MNELRGMELHFGKMSVNENQSELRISWPNIAPTLKLSFTLSFCAANQIFKTKNVQPELQKVGPRKAAFNDLKNTFSATPSHTKLQKPTAPPRVLSTPKIAPGRSFSTQIRTTHHTKNEATAVDPIPEQPLRDDHPGRSPTMLWMPSDEAINRILCPTIVAEPFEAPEPEWPVCEEISEPLEVTPLPAAAFWEELPDIDDLINNYVDDDTSFSYFLNSY